MNGNLLPDRSNNIIPREFTGATGRAQVPGSLWCYGATARYVEQEVEFALHNYVIL